MGKWHLGDQPEFLPTQQGFDEYFGLPYSNDMGPPEDGAKSNPGQPLPERRRNARPAQGGETGIPGLAQPPLPLVENGRVIERIRAAEQAMLTGRYTEKAVKFIRDHRDRPFFLYLPHTAVHFPLYPAAEFTGKSKNGLIGDWIEEVDASVGQVLDTVLDLGLQEHTLVTFTSDNGGALRHGSDNGPLRGGKGSTWEGGVRACTIAWWPGRIPADTTTDAITTMMDILPTLVNLAGGKVPADGTIDGVDLWPVLSGAEGAESPREVFYYFRGLKLEAVRSGAWKLHLGRGELYDLRQDIGESQDVSETNTAVVRQLRSLAETMADDLGLDGVGPGCRPLGRVQDPRPLIGLDGTIREEFTRQ